MAVEPMALAPGLLDDKVVVITGGNSGIGRAAAWIAARLGARVVIAARDVDKMETATKAMAEHRLDAHWVKLNTRDRASVDALFDSCADNHGDVDILINSAGGQFPQPAMDYSEAGWNAVIDTNLNGTFNMMQAAARQWRDTGRAGSILNVVVALRGLHGVAHTSAARSGVIGFSNAVCVEWAPHNIRVNCVAPGAISTEGWSVYTREVRDSYSRTNPVMRYASPWEVAQTCLFVASPGGAYINGETIVIDGGTQHWGEIWTHPRPDHFVGPAD